MGVKIEDRLDIFAIAILEQLILYPKPLHFLKKLFMASFYAVLNLPLLLLQLNQNGPN